ncbi:hypothetical protein BHM03_00037291 [Ensete ventricosum]|nr:hypothetical protein BHM03_00037291 [Ensete ventricosum]
MLCNDRKSYAKLTEVRGIANSKNSVLMQGLVCERWSVRGHPKAIETRRHGALEFFLRYGKDMSVGGMIIAARELKCFSAYIHLREPSKSEDKAEVMGLAVPWYRRGGTSVESSISCSHGGRALVVKGVEEVENAEANSKYQDKVEGQRPKKFIRSVSMDFSSR